MASWAASRYTNLVGLPGVALPWVETYVCISIRAYQCIRTASPEVSGHSQLPGTGLHYRQILLAYGADVTKGFFPYEWMTDIAKLD